MIVEAKKEWKYICLYYTFHSTLLSAISGMKTWLGSLKHIVNI